MELTRDGARAAVIANATDVYSADDRRAGVDRERRELTQLSFEVEELDLREFFDTDGVEDASSDHDLVWVRGGDVWTLRYSMARSGADRALKGLIADDGIVYGGYSAGSCVLAPTLEGLEHVDDPAWVKSLYGVEPSWQGLAVLDFCVVPHVDSPEHPESEACERVAAAYRNSNTPHRCLRDGEVLVINGETEELCAS